MPDTLLENKNLLKSIFSSAIDGIIVISNKGVILLVNPAVVQLFGYAPQELVGNNINLLIPFPDNEMPNSYPAPHESTSIWFITNVGQEVQGRRKDGSLFTIDLRISEIQIDGEQMYSSILHDISVQKATQESIRKVKDQLAIEARERAKELEAARQIAIEAKDQLALEVLERAKELETARQIAIEVKDQLAMEVLERSKELEVARQIAVEVKDQLAIEVSARAKESEIARQIAIEVKDRLAIEVDERAEQLAEERQITEAALRESSEVIKIALKKEQELGELKSRFVSTASHEFRTPLSTILSSAALIERYMKEDQQNHRIKHIQRIKSSVNNLIGVLNDFLSLSKLEEGKMDEKISEFDLVELAHEVVEEIQVFAKQGQQIQHSHEGNTTLVLLNKQFLKNILINLLSNAVKYSNEEQPISFQTIIKPDKIDIKIIDLGIGIPKEEQAYLFERFFRAKNATNIQGTGLGLNIVKKYVDLMNGVISVESNLGEGTTFELSFSKKNE